MGKNRKKIEVETQTEVNATPEEGYNPNAHLEWLDTHLLVSDGTLKGDDETTEVNLEAATTRAEQEAVLPGDSDPREWAQRLMAVFGFSDVFLPTLEGFLTDYAAHVEADVRAYAADTVEGMGLEVDGLTRPDRKTATHLIGLRNHIAGWVRNSRGF